MITRCRLVLSDPQGAIPDSRAYPLYAWLLEQLPAEYGEQFHQSTDHPLSQSLHFDRDTRRHIWTVNLLTDALSMHLAHVLTEVREIPLHTGVLSATFLGCEEIASPEALILSARSREYESNRTELRFLTATSFRQDGRYVLFPQERLIVNSLIRKWNLVCPAYPMEDSDAAEAMLRGVHITDYQLRSARYPLKDVKIPGFRGSITFFARLSPPLMELWRLLMTFAPYAGLGIKTSLGMGGVTSQII